jgi:hypothetical protein
MSHVCRHRYTHWLSLNSPTLLENMESELQQHHIMPQRLSIYGNDVLFFAAASGTHAKVLISLVKISPDVNALNALGQSFLSFLVPTQTLFHGRCLCPYIADHKSSFGCLIRALEQRNFDFDHLDNHGRSWLSLLSSSSYFDLRWLEDLIVMDYEWGERIPRLAKLRDSSDLFLLDFMALNANFDPNSRIGLCASESLGLNHLQRLETLRVCQRCSIY